MSSGRASVVELDERHDADVGALLAVPLGLTAAVSADRLAYWRAQGRPAFGLVDDDRVAAAGHLRAPENVEFEVALVVTDSAARGRGLGSAMWSELRRRLSRDVRQVMTMVRDDDPHSLEIARHWGFEQFQHEIPSALDLGQTSTPLQPAGVTLSLRTDFTAAAADPELAAAYADCDDSPEAQTGQISGWTSFLGLAGDVPGIVVVARDENGPVVGLAAANQSGDGSWVVAFTGVRPQFRRRGIGRAMKLRLHHELAGRGVTRVVTANEAHNRPIRMLNSTLGYVAAPGGIRLRRSVDAAWFS